MDMKRGTTAFAVAVTICIAGCGTVNRYVPPAAGEPQATIRGQSRAGFTCTEAYLNFVFDDQILPYRLNPRAPMPISPGLHTATIRGAYGVAPILVAPVFFLPCFYCHATLQFTAEPSHDYQLVLVKEGAPYHIDLIDSETNQPVASAPCPGGFQTGKQPPAPKPDTGPSFMGPH
jgi:hypothetical protein